MKATNEQTSDAGSTPRVSVVMPVYNREERVGKAIECVLAQSFEDFELVVVDDASTDGTAAAVEAYDDPRVRLLRHDQNRNGSAARNTAMDASRGALTAFLDSDDEWRPNCLERQVARYDEANADSEAPVAVFSAFNLRSDTGEIRLPVRPPRTGESIIDYIADGEGVVHLITLLLPTALAREVRFDEKLPASQDADFAYRVYAAGADFHFIDDVLAVWDRTGEDHVTKSGVYKPLIEAVHARDFLSNRQKIRYLATKIPPRAIRAGDRHVALRYFLLGIRHGIYNWRELIRYTAHVTLPVRVTAVLQELWVKYRRQEHDMGA